ncbi:hypothetical protein HQQ80_07020 [Microbacteriaceae bacterium VKM Ac-2855]|nr:hypothetical protein [Microbacteriaceae bacterium VKM Ac-2855]
MTSTTEKARATWDVLRPDQLAAAEQTEARITPVKNAILLLLHAHGPLTHEQIADRYREAEISDNVPHVTETSIRSRTSELLHAGLVRAADEKGLSRAKRPATRWEAA